MFYKIASESKESQAIMPSKVKHGISVAVPMSTALVFLLFAPERSQAVPAFARKYGVKCYTCHILPPALNKTGYMFKRLGYRMPPDRSGSRLSEE